MNTFTLEDPRLRMLVCGWGRLQKGEWNYSDVSLPYWRFYWNNSPGARLQFGASTLEMDPQSVVLVAPNTIFSTSNSRSFDHLYIHFQIPAFFIEFRPPVSHVTATPPLLGLLQELRKAIARGETAKWRRSLLARSVVHLAVSMLDMEMKATPCRDARVLNILTYLEGHLKADASTNAMLAKQAGMSVSTLNRLFRDQVGHSLQEYIRLKRVEKACLLLQFSHDSIEQIAEATGFCDRYHFSRVFKAVQGIAPAAFRLRHAAPTRSS